ncbi:hypothetical protein RvY_08993 [Ramazzottius varieornatus]|uniref:CIDE-N domain-containing protein n=1 Tax=Ramazzottius varieornatus TaxID=947166 RepID=A0A1D1VFS6_RAMVA|nr:hypothetical protein RvY_08993 [Ramazzottius varieornatus]
MPYNKVIFSGFLVSEAACLFDLLFVALRSTELLTMERAKDATKKPCNVWSCDRKIRKSCTVTDLQSLKTEGAKKLSYLDPMDELRIVSELDGTEIEDDEYFQLLPQFPATFLLLRRNEQWMPSCGNGSSTSMCGDLCTHRCSHGSNGRPSDAVDSAAISGLSDRAVYLFGQLCTEEAYKQLLPWLLLRPADLEEIVNADPDKLELLLPRKVIDEIQENSFRALSDYNQAQQAVQILSLYDKAATHVKQNI